MKIEFTDDQIKQMAKSIDVYESLMGISPASPCHVLCMSNNDSRHETNSLRAYSASNLPYQAMIKPVVDEYQAACLEASRKALIDIRCMFRDLADGNTSLLNTGQ